MKIRLAAGLTCIAAAVTSIVAGPSSAGAAVPTTPTTQPASSVPTAVPTPPPILWGGCPNETLNSVGAQCGMLTVPLNYSKPTGPKIQLAVSRVLHRVSADKYQGVMVTNPGGPGGSGLSLSVLGSYVPNGAGDYYDWIGFDPRGVGASVPAVSCDPNFASFDRPNYIPLLASDLNAWLAKSKTYAAACAAKNGDILNHVTTIDSARDMESLRLALGAPQLNYYGFSYGTYLSLVYATLYPSKVRRMVLDSNVDPTRIWYAANLDQDVAFDRNMKIWFGWLAKYDSVYHLGGTAAAVQATFYRIQSRLTFAPADGKIGGDEWTDIFLNAGYYEVTWLDLAATFANYAATGDPKPLEAAYLDSSGLGDDNGYAMYDATQCSDVQWPTDWATWSRDNWATFARAPYETWGNAWFNAPCLYWPAKAHTPVAIDGSKVTAPVLLIDETLDAATPYSGSLEVRKLFPSSSLLALPGGTSHALSLFGDACEDNQIAAYLATGAIAKRVAGAGPDTTCAPLPQPSPLTAETASVAKASSGAPSTRLTSSFGGTLRN